MCVCVEVVINSVHASGKMWTMVESKTAEQPREATFCPELISRIYLATRALMDVIPAK